VAWWGNVWEYWCFVFERIAGVYTQLLRRFNHRGSLASWLYTRLALREVSSALLVEHAQSAPSLLLDHEQAMRDTVVVSEKPVDEGQLWSPAWLRKAAMVPYIASTRSDRGLVLSELQDTTWQRSNLVCLGNITLKTRTLKEVRRSPWTISRSELEDRRISAVVVQLDSSKPERQVLLVDGVARLVHGTPDRFVPHGPGSMWPDESGYTLQPLQWELVGCLLGEPYHAAGDCCPSIQLPPSLVDQGVLHMHVFPLECVRQLVGVLRSKSEESRCFLINPNEYFLMIPLTPGVLLLRGSLKVMEFPGLSTIGEQQHTGPGIDLDHEEPPQVNPLVEAAIDAEVLLSLGVSSVAIRSLQLLWGLKPVYYQAAGIQPEDVCKELQPSGVARVGSHVLEWRASQGLPTRDLTLLVLGSGIGGVGVAALAMFPHVVANAYGVEKDPNLHDTSMQWLQDIASHSPWLQHCTSLLQTNMLNADFTNDNSVPQLLKRCDVVFSNNYLFDPPTGRQPTSLSLNDKMRQLLCDNVDTNTTIVTTASLSGTRRSNPNKRGRSTRGNTGRDLVEHQSFDLAPNDVSWYGHLSFHIASMSK
jgi:hypothetical protein